MHRLGVGCQVGVVDGFTSWLNVYLGLLVHCWVSGATHGACTVCGVGVVDPLWPVICFLTVFCVGWWVVGVVCENCIVDASILFFVCVCFVLCVGLFVCVFVVYGRMVDALAC